MKRKKKNNDILLLLGALLVIIIFVSCITINSTNPIFYFCAACILLSSLSLIISIIYKRKIKKKILEMTEKVKEDTVKEFFKKRDGMIAERRKNGTEYDFVGIYILFNKTKNKCYVGQSRGVIERVNNHFNGRGNERVYRDYCRGNRFTIKTISLEKSGFRSLNKLERYAIYAFDAYRQGYNKTRGNK